MSNPYNMLKELIRIEEQKILKGYPYSGRMAVVDLARVIDYIAVSKMASNGSDMIPRDLETFYSYGWPKALSLFIDESCEAHGAPGHPMTDQDFEWATAALQISGRLGVCEYVLGLCDVGLAKLTRGEHDTLHVEWLAEHVGLEAVERQDFQWLSGLSADIQKDAWRDLVQWREQVLKVMGERVRPWHEHFIAYETTSEIDQFYERAGFLLAQQMSGQESFPGEAQFGGHDFDLYRAAVGILIGWALKHLDFCQALTDKHPEIDLRNVITYFTTTAQLRRYLAAALGVNEAEAHQAILSTTLTRMDKNERWFVARGPAPLQIEIGREMLLRSFAGCTGNPFYFMLRRLQRLYPKDWDRALDLREEVFRRQLYSFFSLSRFVTSSGNIRIKEGRRVLTDIDAAIYDTKTGTFGLFQLKWQDVFGSSMHERESKRRNFARESAEWVERVHRWLANTGPEDWSSVFGIKLRVLKHFREVRLFVVGRNFAHFSGEDLRDVRAAYGHWPQVLRLIHHYTNPEDLVAAREFQANPIYVLFEALQKDSPYSRAPRLSEKQKMRVSNTTLIFEPQTK